MAHGEEHHHADSDHGHDHNNGIFGEKTELIFAILCGAFLALGFGLSFIKGIAFYIPLGCFIMAYLWGGFYATKEAIRGLSNGEFDIDFLMLVAAAGAAVLGQWAEGSLLLFLFSIGHSLEHNAGIITGVTLVITGLITFFIH